MKRNEIWAAIGTIATIIICLVAGWVQVNSRIAVLEIQVKNDHDVFISQSKKIDEINDKVDDIKNEITEMRGDMKLKQDRFKINENEEISKLN